MNKNKDWDRQPPARFNAMRREERDLSELLGLAKGVLADGVVTEAEACLVRDWVNGHPDAAAIWPVSVLAERLGRIFEDGVVDQEEQKDLAKLLREIVGGKAGIIGTTDATTTLPLDDPQPEIAWTGSVFVFTGKFAFGPRKECERWTIRRNGVCERNLTRHTDYLVIGTFGSRDWIQTSFGRKIEKAVEMRGMGQEICIVSEDHWAEAVMS